MDSAQRSAETHQDMLSDAAAVGNRRRPEGRPPWMEKPPFWMSAAKTLTLAFIVLIGVYLVADGFEAHIPKGYIYGAMGFSALVECLNLWVRRNQGRRLETE